VGVLIHLISCRGQCLSVFDLHPLRLVMVVNIGNLWQEAGGFVVLDPKDPNSIGGDTQWGEPSPINKK
jgi:hypothetical protein